MRKISSLSKTFLTDDRYKMCYFLTCFFLGILCVIFYEVESQKHSKEVAVHVLVVVVSAVQSQ